MTDMKSNTVVELKRVFQYGSPELEDPGHKTTPEEVKSFYAGIYPELNQSVVEGPEIKDGSMIYKFVKKVGTKGLYG